VKKKKNKIKNVLKLIFFGRSENKERERGKGISNEALKWPPSILLLLLPNNKIKNINRPLSPAPNIHTFHFSQSFTPTASRVSRTM
jgi:hypothetical protein